MFTLNAICALDVSLLMRGKLAAQCLSKNVLDTPEACGRRYHQMFPPHGAVSHYNEWKTLRMFRDLIYFKKLYKSIILHVWVDEIIQKLSRYDEL